MSRRRASDITRWMSIGAGVTGLLVLGLAVSLLWPESAARHAAPVALLAGDPARLSTAPGSGRPASAPTASPTAVAPAKATSSTDEASPAGASSVATTPLQAAGASIEAYRGLGSWVDIYDARAWANPRAS